MPTYTSTRDGIIRRRRNTNFLMWFCAYVHRALPQYILQWNYKKPLTLTQINITSSFIAGIYVFFKFVCLACLIFPTAAIKWGMTSLYDTRIDISLPKGVSLSPKGCVASFQRVCLFVVHGDQCTERCTVQMHSNVFMQIARSMWKDTTLIIVVQLLKPEKDQLERQSGKESIFML